MASYDNPWMFNGEPFESEHIQNFHGFVYKITNVIDGTAYIGKKFFWSMLKQKGSSRRKRVESNWKKYWSSSDVLKDLIREFGTDIFKREIISLHFTPGQVNYTEVKVQFQLDVLESLKSDGSRAYYNENIASRYFVPKSLEHLYYKSEETKQKISETLKRKGIAPKTRHESPSEEQRAKTSRFMKEHGKFATTNPQSNKNWIFIVEDVDGVREISGFKDVFLQTHTEQNYTALVNWSKAQNKREFAEHSKIKKSKLHPKYGVKIHGYIRPDGTKVLF